MPTHGNNPSPLHIDSPNNKNNNKIKNDINNNTSVFHYIGLTTNHLGHFESIWTLLDLKIRYVFLLQSNSFGSNSAGISIFGVKYLRDPPPPGAPDPTIWHLTQNFVFGALFNPKRCYKRISLYEPVIRTVVLITKTPPSNTIRLLE